MQYTGFVIIFLNHSIIKRSKQLLALQSNSPKPISSSDSSSLSSFLASSLASSLASPPAGAAPPPPPAAGAAATPEPTLEIRLPRSLPMMGGEIEADY